VAKPSRWKLQILQGSYLVKEELNNFNKEKNEFLGPAYMQYLSHARGKGFVNAFSTVFWTEC
jgi:hypothetical protein